MNSASRRPEGPHEDAAFQFIPTNLYNWINSGLKDDPVGMWPEWLQYLTPLSRSGQAQ